MENEGSKQSDKKSESLVVEVNFKIEKDSEGFPKSRDIESLLCEPLDSDCSMCVIRSIPFYLRNVAYGDTIRTQDDASGNLEFSEVLDRSGFSVYRVLLHDPKRKQELIDRLLKFGVLVEQDDRLFAIGVSSDLDSAVIVDFLLEGKRQNAWGVQDGFIFEG